LKKNWSITESGFDRIPFEKLREILSRMRGTREAKISEILDNFEKQIDFINTIFETKIGRIKAVMNSHPSD
jgi:hypothetical protein